MNKLCDETRRQMSELCWTAEQYQQARSISEHLHECEPCAQVLADYQALQSALKPAATVEPAGGWVAFNQRLERAAGCRRRPMRWGWSIAAGLLVGALALNAALLLRGKKDIRFTPPVAVATNGTQQFPSDMSDASVAKVFSTVSEAFEGRTDWVMLSDNASNMGLSADPVKAGQELLILRLVVTRTLTHASQTREVSQVHLAMAPGSTARVTVPSRTGQRLEFVISTDAKDPQRLALWMALEGGTEKESGGEGGNGLGSMETTLRIPYGQSAQAGQIATADGVFDLSMSLQRQAAGGKGAGV